MKTCAWLNFLFVVVSVGWLTGCSTTAVNTVEPAEPSARRQMLSDQRVAHDHGLAKAVNVIGINTATGPGGFLRIQVEVENTTRKARHFSYRVEWFDEQGILIELPTDVSKPRTIQGRERLLITDLAPTEQAKDFRIKFLEPRS